MGETVNQELEMYRSRYKTYVKHQQKTRSHTDSFPVWVVITFCAEQNISMEPELLKARIKQLVLDNPELAFYVVNGFIELGKASRKRVKACAKKFSSFDNTSITAVSQKWSN